VPQDQGFWRFVLQPAVLKRSLTIAAIVGVLLSSINQGDLILYTPFTPRLALKIVMNFVVPFVVSSVGAAGSRPGRQPPPG
jgi:hypothetical protein